MHHGADRQEGRLWGGTPKVDITIAIVSTWISGARCDGASFGFEVVIHFA
ncbi:hypothetical protein [Mycolicibacterium sp. CBMA 361]|nr:hypothetical protein [Mycolicibacterium sp. CBMA 361]